MPRKSEVTTANLVDHLTELHGPEVDVVQVRNAADHFGVSYPTICNRLIDYKCGRGKWNLTAQEIQQAYESPSAVSSVNYIPEKDDSYVQFGNFSSVRKVVQSRQFYPIFITGLSGNGKTLSVEQACAATNRELIRVNITIETDEDDLIGGFRLVDGDDRCGAGLRRGRDRAGPGGRSRRRPRPDSRGVRDDGWGCHARTDRRG